VTIQAVSADGVVHEFPDETDTGVIGKAMRDYAASNLSVSGDLKGGLHDLGTAVSQGLGAVGATGASNFVKGYTPDAPAGPAPSEQLSGALEHGDWGNVPGLLMHSAARAIPSAVPIIGAGAVGGPLAAGAAAGAMAIGPEAYGRAANNGRSEPTTGDVVGAIPGALGEAVGGALIPGKVGGGLLRRAAGRVASDVAGGAIMDTAGQLGASVGTDQGASFDPYQTAGSALTQGSIGAVRSAKEAAGIGVKAGVDRAVAATLDAPTNRADAESVIRATNLMDQVRQNDINTTGKARPETAVANSVKQDLVTKLSSNIRDLRDVGLLDQSDYRDLTTLIGTQALRGNNTISDAAGSLYGRLGTMGLPEEITSQLQADVRDLNTLSTQSFIKNTTGPFQAAGKLLGRGAAIGGGLLSGSPMGAIEGVIGNPIAGHIGGAIGSGLDRAFGTNTPPIVLQRLNAARAMKNLGLDPSDVQATGNAVADNPRVQALRTPQTPPGQPDPATGLPSNPVPVNTPIPANAPAPGASQQASALPPLRVDTPETVRAAVSQDAPTTPPRGPLQRLQEAQAMTDAGMPPAASTAPSGPPTALPMDAPAMHPSAPTWERLVANGDMSITRQHARDAAMAAHGPHALDALDATKSVNIPNTIAPIQARLGQNAAGPASLPGGSDQPAIRSPTRYTAAIDKYHLHVAADVSRLHQSGQSTAANALLDIAVNHHSKAAKQAARASLPPAVGALIPDYVVNQGGT
jgi:hypothetical protein